MFCEIKRTNTQISRLLFRLVFFVFVAGFALFLLPATAAKADSHDQNLSQAYAFFRSEQYDKAFTLFLTCVKEPNYLLRDYALYGAGECLSYSKEYDVAITYFQSIVDNYPDNGLGDLSKYKIARCNFWLKKYDLAQTQFEALLQQSLPDNIRDDSVGTLNEIYKIKKIPVLKASSAGASATPFVQAQKYFNDGSYVAAGDLFYQIYRKDPKSKNADEALLMAARSQYQRGKIKPALKYFKLVASMNRPSAAAANYYLGLSYWRTGKLSVGAQYLQKTVNGWPDSAWAEEAQYQLGLFYESDGKNEEALAAYKELFKKYPKSLLIGDLSHRLGVQFFNQNRYGEAYEYFQRSLQSSEEPVALPRNIYWLARTAYKIGNTEESVVLFKRLIRDYDHTYFAYRAMEKLKEMNESYSVKLDTVADPTFDGPRLAKNEDDYKEILGIWNEINARPGSPVPSSTGWDKSESYQKFKKLISLGLYPYAAIEGRALTHEYGNGFGQYLFGRMLMTMGEYRVPIRQAEDQYLKSIIHGTVASFPDYFWCYAYPLPNDYWYRVKFYADYYQADPYLSLAVMREESRFATEAVSHSRARGLMQIMPRTGRGIAKLLGVKPFTPKDLHEPNINIGMGTYYLSQLMKRFYNRPELALAGYNGGPNRVSKWLAQCSDPSDVDLFVEAISLRETSYYVKRVMTSYYEYRRLYEGKIN